MTNPHEGNGRSGPGDPIADWLNTEVSLLPPPPGGFQRIRRRARRRKATRAVSVAAGAVLAVAAIVTLPQITATLLPHTGVQKVNNGGGPSGPGTRSPSPSRSGSRPATPSGSARPLGPGTGLAAGDSRIPVPAGFQPQSVTFVGSHTGAALGQIGPPCTGNCVALAGTSNYGQSWYAISGPPASAPAGDTGVSQVRFLDKNNGWAFGPELYATHNGGQSWTKITVPGFGRVIDLATISNRAFAVLATCPGLGADYAAGCTSYALISAPASSNSWTTVSGASGTGTVVPGGLQLTKQQGFLIASGALLTGPVTGGAWHQVQVAASGPPCVTSLAGLSGPWLLAPGSAGLYLVCREHAGPTAPVALYSSLDGGQSWVNLGLIPAKLGAFPAAGGPASLAIAPGGALVLATSTGIFYSAGLKAWQVAVVTGGLPAGGFSFVGMTTTSEGVAVPASGLEHEIFVTTDGGRGWQPSPIG